MTHSHPVYRFDSVLVRSPSRSVVNGLRPGGLGNPTYGGVKAEHEAYVAALRKAHVEVTVLPALEEYPDSIFIEDPALAFTDGAVLLRPGAPTRRGEAAALEPILRARFDTVLALPDGFADGGDVLVTPKCIFVGCSGRTDQTGARALIETLRKLGRQAKVVATPKEVLHLKTGCSLLDDETVLCSFRLADAEFLTGFRQLILPVGEEGAANALRVNDMLMVSAQHPRTVDMLDEAGFNVVPLLTSEIGVLDAGLSCMSLRWLADGSEGTMSSADG